MKWDVWTQWNILIWAHSTFSHIDIPVAFGRLWVLSNVSIPLCWPRPNASLWRWMPWPFLWMRWGCLHRAFFRPYHVFSVTSLVPFKGQGKSRKSDLHTRRLNPFFSRWFQRRDGTPAETEGLCSDCAICRDLSSTKDSYGGDLMGIFRMEASHFLCHHLGGGGLGLTWVGGRRGFWSSKFFFLGFPLGKLKRIGVKWKIKVLVRIPDPKNDTYHPWLGWIHLIPLHKKRKKKTSHQTGKGKKSIFKYTLRWGYVSSQGGPKKTDTTDRPSPFQRQTPDAKRRAPTSGTLPVLVGSAGCWTSAGLHKSWLGGWNFASKNMNQRWQKKTESVTPFCRRFFF